VHDGVGLDRGRECGALPSNEDVDVRPDARSRVKQPVPDARDLGVEIRDDLGDRRAAGREPSRRTGEERDQRSRQVNVGHAQSTSAASTDQIAGRLSATIDQVRPSSRLPYSWPVLVPK